MLKPIYQLKIISSISSQKKQTKLTPKKTLIFSDNLHTKMAAPNKGFPSIKSIATGVGAIITTAAFSAKLIHNEYKNYQVRSKIDTKNPLSSYQILPDLFIYHGYIRIFRCKGDVINHYVIKKKNNNNDESKIGDTLGKSENNSENNNNNDNNDGNSENGVLNGDNDGKNDNIVISGDVLDNNDGNGSDVVKGNDDDSEINDAKDEMKVDKSSIKNNDQSFMNHVKLWSSYSFKQINKISSYISKLSNKEEDKFTSDFPKCLKDCVMTNIDEFIMNNKDKWDLLFKSVKKNNKFDSVSSINNNNSNDNNNNNNNNDNSKKSEIENNEFKWEYIEMIIHFETLYIKFGNKWESISLNKIVMTQSLDVDNHSDLIEDYTTYFKIFDNYGYALLCQNIAEHEIKFQQKATIEIPQTYGMNPWFFLWENQIGYNSGMSTFRKKRRQYLLDSVVQKRLKRFKKKGFHNPECLYHYNQFMSLLHNTNSNENESKSDINTENNNDSINSNNNDNNDNNNDSNNNDNNNSDMDIDEEKNGEIEDITTNASLQDFINQSKPNLTHDEWLFSEESVFLAQFIYSMQAPKLLPKDANNNNNDSNNNSTDSESDNEDMDVEGEIEDINDDYCGPDKHRKDKKWIDMSENYKIHLKTFGYELIYYELSKKGQITQWMLVKSLKKENTFYLVFKGTSNAIDCIVDVGMMPLFEKSMNCTVYASMYAALQSQFHKIEQSLHKHINQNNTNNIIICGHSLGGGYALLTLGHIFSSHFYKKNKNILNIKCITFGSILPYGKDIKKSSLYPLIHQNTINFIYEMDYIPRILNCMRNNQRSLIFKQIIFDKISLLNMVNTMYSLNESIQYFMDKFNNNFCMF